MYPQNPDRRRIIVVSALILILLVLFFFFLVRPSYIGYRTYETVQRLNYSLEDYGKDINTMQSQLGSVDAKFSTCTDFNQKLLGEVSACTDKVSSCQTNLALLQQNLSFTQTQFAITMAELQTKFDALQVQFSNLTANQDSTLATSQAAFNALAQKSANNICCKLRVDNPQIKYYAVGNNSIQCLQEGELAISC